MIKMEVDLRVLSADKKVMRLAILESSVVLKIIIRIVIHPARSMTVIASKAIHQERAIRQTIWLAHIEHYTLLP